MNPMNLLTKDNMSNWLGQGLSYQKIARETGVNENEVSALAKTMGLQSNVSKMVYFKKNAK
jgi:DNA-binding CsgD family transcriptional regulator